MTKVPVILLIDKFIEREVSIFSMKFHKSTDIDGQVAERPRGGQITMRLKALNSGDYSFAAWLIQPFEKPVEKHSGVLKFFNTTNGNLMKTITFVDAYCVDYQEYWKDSVKDDELAHWEDVTISCRQITGSGSTQFEFNNQWQLEE